MSQLIEKGYQLSEEERVDLEQALEEARRGELASDAEAAAMFDRHGILESVAHRLRCRSSTARHLD